MGARRGTDKTYTVKQSDIIPVGVVAQINDLDMTKAHNFLGARFYSDSEGANPVLATGGTLTFEIQTINSEPLWEEPPGNVIDYGVKPCTVDWAANTVAVRATPAGIVGAAFYRLVVTLNET